MAFDLVSNSTVTDEKELLGQFYVGVLNADLKPSFYPFIYFFENRF